MGGHDEKRHQRRPRGPSENAAPDDPAGKAEFNETNNAGCPWPAAQGRNAMLISEDYKQLAERCLKLAGESSDPVVAAALKALATDYLARAGSPAALRRALSWE